MIASNFLLLLAPLLPTLSDSSESEKRTEPGWIAIVWFPVTDMGARAKLARYKYKINNNKKRYIYTHKYHNLCFNPLPHGLQFSDIYTMTCPTTADINAKITKVLLSLQDRAGHNTITTMPRTSPRPSVPALRRQSTTLSSSQTQKTPLHLAIEGGQTDIIGLCDYTLLSYYPDSFFRFCTLFYIHVPCSCLLLCFV